MVAVSLAWQDLMFANMRLVGGDEDGPAKHEVSHGELRYLVRVAFAHLQELRECVRHARAEWPEVDAFLTGLPADAQADLDELMNLNTTADDWIEPALRYLRNQTFHYGAKTNWKAIRWAMQAVANEEGEIVMANPKLAGMRLEFADLISVQHLTRRFPENANGERSEADNNGGDDIEQDRALIETRLRTLIVAVTAGVTAALRFGTLALTHYLDGLPAGVVEFER